MNNQNSQPSQPNRLRDFGIVAFSSVVSMIATLAIQANVAKCAPVASITAPQPSITAMAIPTPISISIPTVNSSTELRDEKGIPILSGVNRNLSSSRGSGQLEISCSIEEVLRKSNAPIPEIQKPNIVVEEVMLKKQNGKVSLNLEKYVKNIRTILVKFGYDVPKSYYQNGIEVLGLSEKNMELLWDKDVALLFRDSGRVYFNVTFLEELLKSKK